MAYTLLTPIMGYPKINATSTAPWTGGGSSLPPLGTIVQAVDPTYGVGEFIFLKGVVGTVVGSWVTYNTDDFTTTGLVANATGPVAVAMSANVASQYGWYQISGKAIGKCLTAFADDAKVFITATSMTVDDTSVAGDLVLFARGASTTVADSGLAEFEIDRPKVTDSAIVVAA
jgi:hypothetical protein